MGFTPRQTLQQLFEFAGPGRNIFQVAKELGKSPWFYPYTAFMRVEDELAGPVLSDEWARIDMVVAQK